MDQAVDQTTLVSVLMPVYNAEKHLREAVDSILAQTHKALELVIINDGSTDGSEAIIRSYQDPRIRLLKNSENKGLIYSLNYGIAACRGFYIARMDADDISLPERITAQLEFMELHPEVGVCGCDYSQFGAGNERFYKALSSHDEVLAQLIFNSSVVHPSLMLRRSALEGLDPVFNAGYAHSEDYELWSKLIFRTRFASVPRHLFRYRIHGGQVTQKHSEQQQASADRVRAELLENLGFTASPDELALLGQMAGHQLFTQKSQLKNLEQFLERLISENENAGRIDQATFRRVLAYKWYTACGYTRLGLWTYALYRNSRLRRINPQDMSRLLLKCLFRYFKD